MNAPEHRVMHEAAPTLAQLALAQLAPASAHEGAPAEAVWLASLRLRIDTAATDLAAGLRAWEAAPPAQDRALHKLANAMALLPIERVALALALAADTDPAAARAVAWLQAPLRDMHPTVGLVAAMHAPSGAAIASLVAALSDGDGVRSGLLQLSWQGRTLADAAISVPPPVALAAHGAIGHWPNVQLDSDDEAPLPLSLQAGVEEHARSLVGGLRGLVVQGPHPTEARRGAAAIAHRLGWRAAFIEGAPPAGLAAWLLLHDALPVFCGELSPGERQRVPQLVGFDGPTLVAAGLEGGWLLDGETPRVWRVPLPSMTERVAAWHGACGQASLAQQLGGQHRHTLARIRQLCRDADSQRLLRGDTVLGAEHIHHAARHTHSELGTLAENLPDDVPDDALVLPPGLRDELERVLVRCRLRDGLADGLGVASRTRYRAGVRMLLVGPSGTGKTLTAGWMATRLGMPLYRVDLAAITSKYIGETEKNLAELFARAEHTEVMLLFDEADALFGKRTEVKDSNDRFANQQTNYLLQRIESFDGIVVLTSNSRQRFDPAFTRRLDAILEYPSPGPAERRSLWLAHLGDGHRLSNAALNRIAASCELAGGHIRNAVLAARAVTAGRAIDAPALLSALAGEYRKLGKQPPASLASQAEA